MQCSLLKTVRVSASLSRRLLLLSTVGLVIGGTAFLPAQEKTAKKNGAGHETRSMEIQVRDENGKPLEGVKLFANLSYIDDSKRAVIINSDLITNSDGVLKFNLPRRVRLLRMWVHKPDYVPEFINFGLGTHNEGKDIPDVFEFQLARGTTLSGTVVDESGKPIPNVKVEVSEELGPMVVKAGTPQARINVDATAVTDKAGKWKITNAPAKRVGNDYQFRLKFKHAQYLSDTKWGELQAQQKVTSAMLREGTAKIILRRGKSVKGTVYNTAGDPVTKGLIIWHDQPYYGSTVHEVEIDQSGHFETIPLPPGKHPITVVTPGFQPTRQIVNVSKSLDELSFTMQPGKTLTLKIVDPSGKPIPKARVGLRGWRGVESLYNWRHSNVLNSRIPTYADENGVYVWDWAPDDAVTYLITAKSFASKAVTLIATETEHVIKLAQPLIASGNVTDAKTGKPIKKFRVTPVIVFRPNVLSTSFRETVPGEDGRYEIKLNDADYDRRHQIRIDADGYRSVISKKSFGLGEDRVTQNFSLEPAAPRAGLVVDGNQKPVSSATVVVATPSIVPYLNNLVLEWGVKPIETSGEGRFEIAATFEPIRIRVIHESGYAEVARQPNEDIGTITLQPWAKVSGTLFQAGQPVPNQEIYFRPRQSNKLGEPRFQNTFVVQTEGDGHFEFPRLPPIAGAIQAYLGPWDDSPLTSSQSVPLDLQPGDQKTIVLGETGATLKGTIVATGRGEAALNKKWSINHLIRRDDGISLPRDFPELSFDPTEPVQTSWCLDPNFQSWLRTRPNYFVKLSPTGQLQIGGVPPGEYDLVVRLYEQPAGCLVETVGEKVVPINVTAADIRSGTKDLGSIEVPCRVGPRVGQYMTSYKFTDTTGREHTINDMKGRYVLMHVWASWCVPCLKSMPDIQATAAQLTGKPITFVGLNIDKRPADAEILAERNHWDWSQNYLGDQSEMARQLAISSVPIYYLIGPDGRLVASTNEWSAMKEKVETTLEK